MSRRDRVRYPEIIRASKGEAALIRFARSIDMDAGVILGAGVLAWTLLMAYWGAFA